MKNGLIIGNDGDKKWYKNDELHRDDGPACEWENGDRSWYKNGKLHRADGPAEKYTTGSEFWYLNGLVHREGGPAISWANVDVAPTWWLNGEELEFPKDFPTIEAWFDYLSDHEEESYQVIADIKGFYSFIKNPSGKQTRLHQMKHLL